MKFLCKECIDGMDVAAPPPAVDRMASSWRWKRFEATLELVRERSMVVDVQVGGGRGEVPEAAGSPRLDWLDRTGLDWRAGRVNLGRCLSVQSTAS